MSSTVAPANLADQLVAFLNGDPIVRETLPERLAQRLLWLARRLAPDLAEVGHADDVVQEAWWLMLGRKPGSFDPERMSVSSYFRFLVYKAARRVRAQFAPPTEPTRPKKDAARKHLRVVSLEKASAEVATNDFRLEETILDPTADTAGEVESKLAANELVAQARASGSMKLTLAMELIGYKGFRLVEAASAVGVSRYALGREFDRLIRTHGLTRAA